MTALLPDLPSAETAIIEMTNAFRREQRVQEVRRQAELDRAAKAFAAYLVRTRSFSHTADGRNPWDRTRAAGYAHCQISENLALMERGDGFETRELAREMVEGWKNSPSHRAAMVGQHVTEIGVAIARAPGTHRYVSVQLFGRPEALKYSFKVRNAASKPVRYTFAGKTQDLPTRAVLTHTACEPGEVAVQGARATRAPRSQLGATYTARNGDLFVVSESADGQLKVDVVPATR